MPFYLPARLIVALTLFVFFTCLGNLTRSAGSLLLPCLSLSISHYRKYFNDLNCQRISSLFGLSFPPVWLSGRKWCKVTTKLLITKQNFKKNWNHQDLIEFLSRLRLQRYGKFRNWQNFWTDFYVIKHILFPICLITHILKNQKSLCSKQGKTCNKAEMPRKVTRQHLRTTEQTPSPLATTTLPSIGKNFISSRYITPVPLSTLLQNKRDQPRKPRPSAQPTHYYK